MESLLFLEASLVVEPECGTEWDDRSEEDKDTRKDVRLKINLNF